METSDPRTSIRVLPDSVARKIAAGEVIDRPLSVVRELLDNAIDAGAGEIALYLRDGGVSSVRCVDNGTGMTKEDLELCWLAHATSKIETEDDLYRLRSLGFRGEALSSIATCSKLLITSRRSEAAAAFTLRVEGGRLVSLGESQGSVGTIVEVADLFFAIPGRRKFLKGPSAETGLCRSMFLDKALPFPAASFKLFVDGVMKLYLPHAGGARGAALKERCVAAHGLPSGLLRVMEMRGSGFSATVIAGGPSLYRRDRRQIQIFVNSRRIYEFGLIQAVEYGFGGLLPGGHFPVAFVFLEIDPSLVDFNIHPAKREARLRNLPEIHHALVELIRRDLGPFALSFGASPGKPGAPTPSPDGIPQAALGLVAAEPEVDFGAWRTLPSARAVAGEGTQDLESSGVPAPAARSSEIRYFGQAFGLFLLAEVGERLFLVDQHAAHERLLFEEMRSRRGAVQSLLVPRAFEASEDEEEALAAGRERYEALGISARRVSEGRWEITRLPEACLSHEESVVEFLLGLRGTVGDLERELFATVSCRAALKEGDPLDALGARELIAGVFGLEDARCPHGRPIWFELSRADLYRLVGRIL